LSKRKGKVNPKEKGARKAMIKEHRKSRRGYTYVMWEVGKNPKGPAERRNKSRVKRKK